MPPRATHQQLLRDKLHDQLLGPLLRLPGGEGGEASAGCKPGPTRPRPYRPSPTSSRRDSRRPGRAVTGSVWCWRPQRQVWASEWKSSTCHGEKGPKAWAPQPLLSYPGGPGAQDLPQLKSHEPWAPPPDQWSCNLCPLPALIPSSPSCPESETFRF